MNEILIPGEAGALAVALIRLLCLILGVTAALAWYRLDPWRATPPLMAWAWTELRDALGRGLTRTIAVMLAVCGLSQGLGVATLDHQHMPLATGFVLLLNSLWAVVMGLLLRWAKRQPKA